VVIEVEPADTSSGEGLSASAQAGLETALDLVRLDVRRFPVLGLADELAPLVEGDRLEPSASRDALRQILQELALLDREGRWGRTFALRDRLRLGLAHEFSSEAMDHRDWALWWGLIEELDRLQTLEAV